MEEEQIIEEFGIDFAIETLAPKITQEIEKYKKSKDEKSAKKLAELLEDRRKIYANDKDTIRKYVKINGGD